MARRPQWLIVWVSLAFMTAWYRPFIVLFVRTWVGFATPSECDPLVRFLCSHSVLDALLVTMIFWFPVNVGVFLGSAFMLWYLVRIEFETPWAIGTIAALTGWFMGFVLELLLLLYLGVMH
ncbi:hypothetical protein ACWGQ5_06710 [Streptomyces sp. NPDC055722]